MRENLYFSRRKFFLFLSLQYIYRYFQYYKKCASHFNNLYIILMAYNKRSDFFVTFVSYTPTLFYIFLFVLGRKTSFKAHVHTVRGSTFTACHRLRSTPSSSPAHYGLPADFQGRSIDDLASLRPPKSSPAIYRDLSREPRRRTRGIRISPREIARVYLDYDFRDPPTWILAIIGDPREPPSTCVSHVTLVKNDLDLRHRRSRTMVNDPDHSRLSRRGYHWLVPLGVLS